MTNEGKRKILYVVSRFPSLTTTFTAYEMATVQQCGADVHVASVWSPDNDADMQTIERQFASKVLYLKLTNPVLWLISIKLLCLNPALVKIVTKLVIDHSISIFAMLKLIANIPKGLYLGYWASQNNVEHIHAHFLSSPATVALLASCVSKISYTVTIHAFDIFATNAFDRNAAIAVKCERASACVVISKFNKRYIQEKWPAIRGRFELIYNGIDLELFSAGAKIYNFPSTRRRFNILTIGRLVETKGHHYLLQAVSTLVKQGQNIALTIIGLGPLDNYLREKADQLGISDRVIFRGAMLQEEIVQEYRACDLFVLACAISSDGDMDGLPVVLVEALAMEVPTISTSVSGVTELIEDHETGLCVPPHNSDVIANAISYMMTHPDEARRMARAGRAKVVRDFDRHKSAQKLLCLWQSLEAQKITSARHM